MNELWTSRAELDCAGEAAGRVGSLLADRIESGRLALPRIVLSGVVG